MGQMMSDKTSMASACAWVVLPELRCVESIEVTEILETKPLIGFVP